MEQQIHFCTTDDGVRIAYATVGEGPPLVKAANWLSHLEFDWRSPVWRHLLAECARDHTFIRYDERGNGLSDWNVADLSFEAWVKDLESVVEAAGVDQFPLLGISQGGAVAIAYAVRHPEKVSRLILYGAYARGWATRASPAEIEQRQAQLTLVRLGWGQDNPAFRQLWTTLYAPDATPEQAQSFNDLQRISTSPENAVALLNVMGHIDVVDLLPQVKVPTLVLHCRDEAGVPFEEGRLLASSIPGARFVPLDGRNHLLLEGAPAWGTFVKEMRRFLGTEQTSTGQARISGQGKPATPMLTRTDLPDRYTIISFLGVGGMGEVYLAEDTKLGRKVALKTLPAEFTNDRERLRRFQQEARAASALNHPNLLTIHEIGAEGGVHFIAAEYIDGETLRARLKHGRLKIDDALDMAQQTAFALTAAHGAGIVHRDIKPENIMVRHDGIVKVLDFGLAKLLEDHAREMVDHEADTRALVMTDPGRVLGTPQYMSPEQARGLDLDARTDIWSLGVVLYEMVAGRAPFRGETNSHTVVAILESEPPPLATFAPETPAELQRIVRKALTKDRDSRYQTARDLMIDLKSLRRDLDIQSEMQRSSAPGISGAETTSQQVATKEPEAALSEQATSLAEPRPTRSDGHTPDGSIRYRIGALVAMLLLAVGALGIWYYFQRQHAGTPINSIAVMPFVNESGNNDVEYLSDGMTESLITSLSQLPNLSVKARSSVFRYKGKDASPQQVGKELNVQAIVNGRVVQRGNDLTLHIELVDVDTETALWSGDYNRSMTNLVSLQSEIARDVANKLRTKLSDADKQKLTKNYTQNTEAYQAYLKGQYYWNKGWNKGLVTGFEKSRDYYQQAIDLDPTYALAYAGLADYYGFAFANGLFPPEEKWAKAEEETANKALALDPTLGEAYNPLAAAKLYYHRDWPAAERYFRRGIELSPNFAEMRHHYALCLVLFGRNEEALGEMQRAIELDPLSLRFNWNWARILFFMRQYDRAIDQYRKTLELDQNFASAHEWLGDAYEQKGMHKEAIAAWAKALTLSGEGEQASILERAYAASGFETAVHALAQKKLERLNEKTGRGEYVPASEYVMAYLRLGDKEKVFGWLAKAVEERNRFALDFKVNPIFDSLRSDPRFADLVRSVGLLQ